MKFIFEVQVRPGSTVEEYAEVWLEASRIIQQAPGARGTYLHRKIGHPDTVLAIAHWDSKAARDAMEQHVDADRVRQLIGSFSDRCDIRLIGEFEEPEWQVVPSS